MWRRDMVLLAAIAMICFGASAALIGCGGGETADRAASSRQTETSADGEDVDATPGGENDMESPASGTDAGAAGEDHEGATPDGDPDQSPVDSDGANGAPGASAETDGVPRLVDLGSKQCIPCQRMAPVLDELTEEYAGRMEVVFIDVWLPENEAVAEAYGIRNIPTQIFFDGAGRELARHVGYMSKEDILSMWEELGVDFS